MAKAGGQVVILCAQMRRAPFAAAHALGAAAVQQIFATSTPPLQHWHNIGIRTEVTAVSRAEPICAAGWTATGNVQVNQLLSKIRPADTPVTGVLASPA